MESYRIVSYLFSIFGGGSSSNSSRKGANDCRGMPRVKGIKQFRFNAKDMRSIWDMAVDMAEDMPKDTKSMLYLYDMQSLRRRQRPSRTESSRR